jgi:hypothetical protein
MLARARRDEFVPVVAINADFYAGKGYTISHHVVEGKTVQTGPKVQSDTWSSRFKEQFGIMRGGNAVMERLDFAGSVLFPDGIAHTIEGINVDPAAAGGMTVRTSFGVPDSAEDSLETVWLRGAGVRGDTVLAVSSDRRVVLDPDEMILRWDPDSVQAGTIGRGDTLRLLLGFRSFHQPSVLVGGLPRIVIDGKLNPALLMRMGGPPTEFAGKRHPRTGVGISRDSTVLLLFTVDGRQEKSAGMSLLEFGSLMLSHGVYQGLNLDGGGSTTMVCEDTIVNSPSDATGERAVANCLVILRRGERRSGGGSPTTGPGGI